MASFSQIVCFLTVVLIAYLVKVLYDVGEFSVLYPKNVRDCKRIEGYHGCEDFAFFDDKRVYMSCDDRSWLAYQWIQTLNLSSRIQKQKKQGEIYLLKPGSYDKPEKLKLKNYNYHDFHPLGIASLKENNNSFLYTVNSRRDGQFVDIFKIDNDNILELYASVTSPEFTLLNDLTVIPNSNGGFYVTNWMSGEPGTLQIFFEVYLRLPQTFVLYCEPNTPDFLSTKPKTIATQFNCRRVIDKLRMANGITKSFDNKRVYVIETSGRKMNIYDHNINTHNLTFIKSIPTNSGCDNIEMSLDNNLYLGCHPKSLTFQFHAQMPETILAPTRILKYKDNNHNNDNFEIVLESLGEILAGSSLGIKIDNHLLVGSVHDNCYLLCKNFKY